MEKIPAACAMEWSIQLDKCLRSNIPGKAIEGILEIGARLEWWNSEPDLTMAEYKMFGLIPGEDKLFLNAIFLRLADAFRSGDKQTKIFILKIFLSLLKRSRKLGYDKGILCKDKLDNYQELLRRLKIVFDSGDVEERALALGLFGCWVNIAKDSADIRYLILSSLVSTDALEVKASLFAGRCFCEMAGDFGSVFLELLVNILTSCEITTPVKFAAGRAFAKIWCPFQLADRAYKTGLKLALDSSEEDFAAIMLISLSKIASKWTLLIPYQDPAFDLQFKTKGGTESGKKSSPSVPSSNMRKASSTTNIVDDLSSLFGAPPSYGEFHEVEGESEERRRGRLERHERTQERAAKALAEKNHRDLEAQREQEERNRIAEMFDFEIKRWAAGKEGNLRALLSTLQYDAWNKFNSEELL